MTWHSMLPNDVVMVAIAAVDPLVGLLHSMSMSIAAAVVVVGHRRQ